MIYVQHRKRVREDFFSLFISNHTPVSLHQRSVFVYCIVLITIIYFTIEKSTKWFIRFLRSVNLEMDDIDVLVVNFILNIKYLLTFLLVIVIVGTASTKYLSLAVSI
jgi:hypothetical protein